MPNHVRIRRQLRGYVGHLGWVLRDALRQYPGRSLLIVLLNLIGVSTAAISLGGIVLLAQHGGRSEPVHLMGRQVVLPHSNGGVLLFSLCLAGIGLLSGWCLYATERRIVDVTRDYERFCAKRLLSIAVDPSRRGWSDLVDGPARTALPRLLHSGSRYTAYVFRDILRLILPLLTFLIALGALIRIDWRVTLMLTPVVVAYALPLYLVNLRVAKNQAEFRRLSPTVRGSLGASLRRLANGDVLDEAPTPAEVYDSIDYDRFGRLHYSRLLANKRVQFLNTVFATICLLALLTYFSLARDARSWTELLAYVVALRFAVSALRQVSGVFVRFSRFLPEYRAYALVVEGSRRIASRRAALPAGSDATARPLTIKLGRKAAWNSPHRLAVGPTEILWAIVPHRVGRCDLEAIAARLEHRLVEPLDLASRAAIVIGANGQSTAAPFPAGAPIIAAETALDRMDPAAHESAPAAQARTIIVGQSIDAVLNPPAFLTNRSVAGVLIMDDRRIIAGGGLDWLRQNRVSIAETLAAFRAQTAADDDEDDDDELDMSE